MASPPGFDVVYTGATREEDWWVKVRGLIPHQRWRRRLHTATHSPVKASLAD